MSSTFFKWVKETNKMTNHDAGCFITHFYQLTNLAIAITLLYWQVLSFVEDFVLTNVFA